MFYSPNFNVAQAVIFSSKNTKGGVSMQMIQRISFFEKMSPIYHSMRFFVLKLPYLNNRFQHIAII
jgi:hypothetical protein